MKELQTSSDLLKSSELTISDNRHQILNFQSKINDLENNNQSEKALSEYIQNFEQTTKCIMNYFYGQLNRTLSYDTIVVDRLQIFIPFSNGIYIPIIQNSAQNYKFSELKDLLADFSYWVKEGTDSKQTEHDENVRGGRIKSLENIASFLEKKKQISNNTTNEPFIGGNFEQGGEIPDEFGKNYKSKFQKTDSILDISSLPDNVRQIVEDNQLIIVGRVESIVTEKAFIEENRKFISFYSKEFVNKIRLKSVDALLSFKEKEMELLDFMAQINSTGGLPEDSKKFDKQYLQLNPDNGITALHQNGMN